MADYTVGSIKQKKIRHITNSTILTTLDSGRVITVESASAVTITLPLASDATCAYYDIIRIIDTTAVVTIATSGSNTITIMDMDNKLVTSKSSITSGAGVAFMNSTVNLFSTGTEWVGKNISMGWA